MSHLSDNDVSYLKHLVRAWKWAFVLLVHGLFPNIWQTKVSDEICGSRKSSPSRRYMLKAMYNIEE
ncbi:hypothetical protein OAU13_00630 [bacterium]|nr:hypothetical protein [bacterium]